MSKYDSRIIYHFADELDARASQTIVLYIVVGVLVGVLAGYLMGGLVRFIPGIVVLLVGALIFGVIGYIFGSNKAFEFKLQAQIILCQVAIEANTRSLSVATSQSLSAVLPVQSLEGQQARITASSDSELPVTTCPKCGEINPSGTIYCSSCGARLGR